MAVNWLKGLVAPAAFSQPDAPPPAGGAPPVGGAAPIPPQASPYGDVPPVQQVPQAGGYALPTPMTWSQGTRTLGGTASASPASPGAPPHSLEARCAELTREVESLALFARTLYTILEEQKLITRAQFEEIKNRLDAMDGKIDDR